jgi:tRNA 2-thiouridine synthesizing protein A
MPGLRKRFKENLAPVKDMDKLNVKKTLDCIGFFCPLPIVKTKIELESMKPGDVLEILADDPGFEEDIKIWCQMTGEILAGIEKEGNVIKGYVKKK